ncbi:cell division protein ZapA [bacterium AH-315-K05]|nr:cell division protein ZapA [bacterium AH-315-K05]
MGRKNKIIIRINGQEYPIVGYEKKEYLLKVGSFVDEKMEEISKKNTRLSTSMIAVLTSINIADQYFKLMDEYELIHKQSIDPLEELDETKELLEITSDELIEKGEKMLVIEEQLRNLLAFKEEHLNENIKIKQELKERELELLKAEEIINNLQNKLYENQMKLMEIENSPNES